MAVGEGRMLDWMSAHHGVARTFGDFRIVRPLREGGMGSLYVAEQLSTGRPRVLKLMQPHLVADPKLRARFEQEARIGSRIASDHVVDVVAAGIDDGTPWLAMELLHGEDLATRVQRTGRLAPSEVLDILEQLSHAIGAAHDANIVHRDLKPENVFLAERRSAAPWMVKVLDFGIAKVVADATATAAIGSPRWMAPEQSAHGGSITPRTDVWAIGLLAFYMLTGRVYWRSGGDEGVSPAQLLREMLMDPMPAASQRATELGLQGPLPAGFDAWFARSVDRLADARFPDARAQFLAFKQPPQALARTEVAPLETARAGPSREASRPHGARGSSVGPALGAVAALLLLCGLGVAGGRYMRQQRAADPVMPTPMRVAGTAPAEPAPVATLAALSPVEPAANTALLRDAAPDIAGDYQCSFEGFPAMRCRITRSEGKLTLEKLEGSVRFRGAVTEREDGFAFQGGDVHGDATSCTDDSDCTSTGDKCMLGGTCAVPVAWQFKRRPGASGDSFFSPAYEDTGDNPTNNNITLTRAAP